MLKNEDYEALLHEIKNALSVIGCSLQLIERQHPEVLGYAFWEDTALDLASLRALLVDVSNTRLCDHPQKSSVDIPSFLQEVYESSSRPAFSNYTFTLDIEPNIPNGYFDAFRIRHALLRIIKNSTEAIIDGGYIALRAFSKNNGIVLEVEDNGCGIPEDAFSQIYQPFFCSKKDRHGLGLPIAKGIVDGHQGTLTINSELAKGTTITIFLPNS